MIRWDCKRSGTGMRQRHGAYFSSNRTEKKGKISEIIDNKVTCTVQNQDFLMISKNVKKNSSKPSKGNKFQKQKEYRENKNKK